MKLLLSVEEACSFLQMNERTLKSGLISGTLDIGSAIINLDTNTIFLQKELRNIWE